MQWYETFSGEERLRKEVEKLSVRFPQMRFSFLDDGAAAVSGFIGLSETLRRSYLVVAEFPYTYGDGSEVRVFLPEERLPSDTPHKFSDGEICVQHNDATPRTDIIDVIGWTIEWLSLFEGWLETGKGW